MATCYNHFSHWERGVCHDLDEEYTTKLAKGGFLPFVDTFPWFIKDDADYPAARKFLSDYLGITMPLIVLAYGEVVSTTCFQ